MIAIAALAGALTVAGVLLHDGSDAEPARDTRRTIDATAALLERLSAEGYRFVTVPELVTGSA